MHTEERVINGRNNIIALKLSVDGAQITHDSITRCQLDLGDTLVDSAVNPEYFDLTNSDRLLLKLGAAGLPVGRYHASLYIFDAQNTLGLQWGDLLLSVK